MEIKLKLREVLAANHGFSQCDAVKDDSTRWNIVKNKRLLQAEVDAYEEIRVPMVYELSPENKDISKESTEVQNAFRVRTKALLDAEVTVAGLLSVKKAPLLEARLPLTVLESIFPFIDDSTLTP